MACILIIDDDPIILDILSQTLAREGYEVVGASNGKEGLKLFRKNPFDLIITDMIMPEKEGIETIIEIRRDFPDVKIIAISGGGKLDAEQYLFMAQKLGVEKTFTKPIPRTDLITAVSELLQ